MKKLLIILVSTVLLSCNNIPNFLQKKNEDYNVKINKIYKNIDHGLYEIKIDDSTTVILYGGTESCAMIKK